MFIYNQWCWRSAIVITLMEIVNLWIKLMRTFCLLFKNCFGNADKSSQNPDNPDQPWTSDNRKSSASHLITFQDQCQSANDSLRTAALIRSQNIFCLFYYKYFERLLNNYASNVCFNHSIHHNQSHHYCRIHQSMS